VCLLGVGDDGHTASLLPDTAVLGVRDRWVAVVAQGRPQTRITLTYAALESSRAVGPAVDPAKRRANMTLPNTASGATAISRPSILVIMGVSGSGKTTIATLLAQLLHCELADADAFHSGENVRKMVNGIALTDEDRWPWLRAIAAWNDTLRAAGRYGVIACSALKRSYRDILIGEREDVRLVYLKGDIDLIARRMKLRHGHFMPLVLLRSQFDTLEEPTPDERPIVVSIDADPATIAEKITAQLRMQAPTP
jgi:gluconokinase